MYGRLQFVSPTRIWSLCLIFPLLATVYLFSTSGTHWSGVAKSTDPLLGASGQKSQPRPPNPPKDDYCDRFPDPGNVVISVRTGATEAMDKLPTILTTYLQCAKHVILFSDMEQWIMGQHVHDALERVAPSIRDSRPEFELYRKQQELKRQNRMHEIPSLRDMKEGDKSAAWILDKYKHLHTIQRTWELYPDMDWYVFLEADTYLVWANLLAYLSTLDATKTTYFGSLSLINDLGFAHGGSGYFFSKPTISNLTVDHPGAAAEWDQKLSDECCGDFTASRAFADVGIELKSVWPIIQGESLDTIPFGPDYWCKPVVTMHHVQPTEARKLYDFERHRAHYKKPLSFSELFTDLEFPVIISSREDWDNLSENKEFTTDTLEACRAACHDADDCFQFHFNGELCRLHDRIRMGTRKDPEGEKRWTSEWRVDKINKWVKNNLPCKMKKPWET
ncbi:hypothetical protein P152DRAFT_479574 [Eremomyces bilateralis CBS 781.70]|uniref:Glycosyltransferase family 31 protein n=1 Tax=Eremomyces bilateralis CBS 781.70 TaxID=1392243 RepID=A0A6G1GCG0_9PEZI|nr:uncharacterized protein P152DRAFT_479574 [Eremomyces bilateralis CBS 781.70]KAF1815682.1 hypothetical protein P152DRAFT_479574 [Eremomyces bilateralis CBS 781.70]